MKSVVLILLLLSHLSGPGLAEAPMVTECQELRHRVKRLEALELYAVRHGWKVDLRWEVWR